MPTQSTVFSRLAMVYRDQGLPTLVRRVALGIMGRAAAKADVLPATYYRIAARKTFQFQGRSYPYFFHHYNTTWKNERCVEVPIVREEMRRFEGKRILEVGNVLHN